MILLLMLSILGTGTPVGRSVHPSPKIARRRHGGIIAKRHVQVHKAVRDKQRSCLKGSATFYDPPHMVGKDSINPKP